MKNALYILIILFINIISAYAHQARVLPHLDKLPIHSIHRIFQDSEGYIWYGTCDGLCRDDGYGIRVFRSDINNPNVMKSNLIHCIAEDKNKKIWFGTDKGLYYLDKKDYSIHEVDFLELKDKKITNIIVSSDGRIWLGGKYGLLMITEDQNNIIDYGIDERSGDVTKIYEDSKENIWIATYYGGIQKVDKETKIATSYRYRDGMVGNHIIEDTFSDRYLVSIWGEGVKALNIYEDGSYSYSDIYSDKFIPYDDRYVIMFFQDENNGQLWMVTHTDLVNYEFTESKELKKTDTSGYLPSERKMLSEIIKDNEGRLWIAAFDRESFMINQNDDHINEFSLSTINRTLNVTPAIVSLCKEDDGVFWFSQARVGLCLYSPESEEVVTYSQCPETMNIFSLYAVPYITKSQKDNMIWAVTEDNMIFGIKRKGLTMNHDATIDLSTVTSFRSGINTIFEDRDEHLWIGTGSGLYRYNIRTARLETANENLGFITGITQTSDGTIWTCVKNKGILKIDKDKSDTLLYNIEKDFSCLNSTSDGLIWLGTTSGGIFLFNPAKGLIDYSSICDMNGDIIESILVDDFNHLWILSNQCVKEFNPRNNVYYSYFAKNSQILNRFLPKAAYKGVNEMYFGGIPGLLSIKPSNRLERIPRNVKPLITDVKIESKSILGTESYIHDGNIIVEPYEGNIEIEFSILDHWNISQIRYAYRLKDTDKEWIYVSEGRNSAYYNKLNKGDHIFQVKATDGNGLWSDGITEIRITKKPAIYETFGFRLLITIVCLIVVFTMTYLFIQHKANKSRQKLMQNLLIKERESKVSVQEDPKVMAIESCGLTSADEQLIINALKVIEGNLDDTDFDISVLAERLNITKVTLSRKIKNITGYTALEFIKSIKLKHACQMLKNKNVSVSEVIAAIGYSDHKHFTITFKNAYGMTPSEYQKKQIQEKCGT